MSWSIDASEIARMGAGFSSVSARVPEIVEPGLQRAATKIRDKAKGNINHKSGKLGASGKVTKIGRMVYEVRFEAFNKGFNYASAVEFGRGPVRPINAKVLRFNVGGKTVFTKYAGPAPAQRFLGRVVDSADSILAPEIAKMETDLVRAIEASF